MAGTGDAAWKVSAPGSWEQQAMQFVLAGDTGGQSQPLRPQFPQLYNKNLFSKPPLMAPPPQHTPPRRPCSHRPSGTCLSHAGAASQSSPGQFSVSGQLLWATGRATRNLRDTLFTCPLLITEGALRKRSSPIPLCTEKERGPETERQ